MAVRCRPMNGREKERGATCLIRMEGNQTIITKPPDPKTPNAKPDVKSFTYDYSYWSYDSKDPKYASQETVYNDLGKDLLNHAFSGYNTCIFACKSFLLSSEHINNGDRWSNWSWKILLNGNFFVFNSK